MLLDAAADLLVEQGLPATSVEQIAHRAGVAKGTFYHYFRDRAAMLEALRSRYSERFADHVDAAVGACGAPDWDARLVTWVEATVGEYLATYALHNAIFHDPDLRRHCVISDEGAVICGWPLRCKG
jgi:AcrR family transcriptional regulator